MTHYSTWNGKTKNLPHRDETFFWQDHPLLFRGFSFVGVSFFFPFLFSPLSFLYLFIYFPPHTKNITDQSCLFKESLVLLHQWCNQCYESL